MSLPHLSRIPASRARWRGSAMTADGSRVVCHFETPVLGVQTRFVPGSSARGRSPSPIWDGQRPSSSRFRAFSWILRRKYPRGPRKYPRSTTKSTPIMTRKTCTHQSPSALPCARNYEFPRLSSLNWPTAVTRQRCWPHDLPPLPGYDADMRIGCAECGCIVDSGVRVSCCDSNDCCRQHPPVQS